MSPTSISISSFVQDALDHFKELGYGKATIKTHTIVYGKLLCYAQLHHHNEYCAEVGEAFLAKEKDRLHPDTFYYYSLAIQRLDCFNSGIEWHPKERLPRKKPYTTCFDPLVNEVMEKLKDRGYATATIGKYDTVYRDLEQYCRLKGVHHYSAEVGAEYMIALRKQGWSRSKINLHNNAIHRLNCVLTKTEWTRVLPRKRSILLKHFNGVLDQYEEYLQKSGKSRTDIRQRILTVSRFLKYAEEKQISQISEITGQCVLEAFQHASGKRAFCYLTGAFLRYVHMYELIEKDLSIVIPRVRVHTAVPSVYTPEEIECLLASINRNTATGKRDYAVILLAARLGLRASDITALTFRSIDSDRKAIQTCQEKTGVFLSLPLSDELVAAIKDYIENGRPNISREALFLEYNGCGSLTPCAVNSIVRRSLQKAGIKSNGRKRGPHSLRASLASALLNEGNDYYTVKEVLGQISIQSTAAYTKADVETLRICALPVPEPSGSFKAVLEGGRAV